MLNNPTVEKLKDMKLKVMAQLLSDPDPALRELSFEERFGIMVEKEWMSRKNSRIKRLLYNASLGVNACIEDIDYTQDRKIKSYTLEESRDILEIAESRYNKASTILSGQVPHTHWYDLFPDPTIADAIMDRIIHNTYILALDSKKSMREVMAEKTIKEIRLTDL